MKSIDRLFCSALSALFLLVQFASAQMPTCFNPDPNGYTGPCQDCDGNTIACAGVNSFNAATGNVWREIPDITLFAGVGETRLDFRRVTTSRYHGAIPTPLGSGGSWRHNYYWHVYSYLDASNNEVVEVNYPDGTRHSFWRHNAGDLFMTSTPSIQNRIEHATGDTHYYLLYPDGRRVAFNKPSNTNGIILRPEGFYDRYNNYYSFLTDAKTRVTRVTEPAGRWIQINYGSVGSFSVGTVGFSYTDTAGTDTSVTVAGEFNGWNTTANPMTKTGNTWTTSIPIQLGTWQYKFVRNGSIYIPDPANPVHFPAGDPNGNSVATVSIGDNGIDGGLPTPVPFTYTNATATTVKIAGTFNGWSATANPMTKIGSIWTATINIPNGSHQYKLVVNGNYITDPGNPFTAPDGFGGYNSKLAVGPLDEAVTSVTTSDGRTVSYNYAMSTVGTTIYSQLMQVNYPDATHASYTYTQPFSGGRPLLKTVDDPRYQGPAKKLQYTYQNTGVEGFVFEEKSLLTGTVLARVVPPTNETARTVLSGNGGSHTINLNTWQMTSRTDSLNRTWTDTYYVAGGESMLQSQTDPLGRTTSFERTYEFGVIKKTILPDLKWRAVSFADETHPFYPASATDENGKVTNYTRDASHRITRIDYPDAGYETFTFNGYGQPLTHRLPIGSTETMNYDARGMLISKIDGAGQTWQYAYEALDRLATVTDPRTNATGYTYNDRGQTLRVTNPGGSHRDFTYDSYGNRLTVANELGKIWTYAFDEYSRITSITDPLSRATQYSYGIGVSGCGSCHVDAFPTGITTQGSKQTVIAYDTEWQKLSETTGANSADAATVGYAYDLAGNLLTMTDARLKPWTSTYDTRNRRLTSKDPLNNQTTWTYDGAGNVLTEKRPDTGLTTNTYDAMNRVLTTRNPNLELTQYARDGAGNLTTLTDARSNAYGFTYDGLSRKTSMTYPGDTHENWTYDPAGNVATYRNRNASIKTCAYDTRNRETSATWNDGSTPAVTRTYDDVSRLLTLNNANSAITYAYDFANQLLSETQNVAGLGAKTMGYTYDLDGNRATLTYPGGKIASYTYTQRNQPDTIAYDGPPPLVNYDYDLAGNRTLKTGENNARTAYGYDDASRLGSVDHQRNVGGTWTSFQSFSYTLNTTGNRTDRYEANLGVTKRDKYTYDPNDQIDLVKYNFNGTTQDRTVDYNFDAVGNRSGVTDSAGQTPATYATNTLNQYTTVASVGQSYDANGNQTVRGYPVGGGSAYQDSYGYDAQNRMTVAYIQQSFGGSSPARYVNTYYDGRNRVVKRVFTEYSGGSGQNTTYYVWDDWNLLVDYTTPTYYSPPVEVRRYVHGAAVDEILLAIGTTPAQTVHHHHDGLGSVTALTDANGALVERYTYDVFGTPTMLNASGTTLTASGYGNRFLFTGREWMKEVNLYDYRNRVYSASQGRFLQTDPIRFKAGDANLLRYVINGATIYYDPSGLAPAPPPAGAGKAAAYESGLKKGLSNSTQSGPAGSGGGGPGTSCSVEDHINNVTKSADVTVPCTTTTSTFGFSYNCPGTQTCPKMLRCDCSAPSSAPGTPVSCNWVLNGEAGTGPCTPCVKN